MQELVSAAQMRAIEAEAIAAGHVTGLSMMERAGRGVVGAILARWPEFKDGGSAPAAARPPRDISERKKRAVVLCGPGNNGGDGFVVARRLVDLGWEVEVFFYGAADRLGPDARRMYDLWLGLGGAVAPMEEALSGGGARPDVLVDALFGTGLSRPIPLVCAEAFQAVRGRVGQGPVRCVAVDCISGMEADSGQILVPTLSEDADFDELRREVLGRQLAADLVVTFHRAKWGHFLAAHSLAAPVVVDIGVPGYEADQWEMLPAPDRVRLVEPGVLARPWLRHAGHLGAGGHKYERGHALVIGGGPGHGGAGRLAARGALRVGAGLVTLAVPPEAMPENAAQLTAIMLREAAGADDLARVLEDDRLSSICIGPGLGLGQRTRAMVEAALGRAETERGARRYVLDADALTAFQDQPDALFALCTPQTVLTPHEGEFARLFPDLSERTRCETGLSKVEAVRQAAARAGAVVLLKGEATVIGSPDGRVSIHAALYDRAAPWLGTAGAGDVLAGFITGLLAHARTGETIHDQVELAAWLHVEAARAFGPGLIAEDLPEALPQVYRRILAPA